MIDLRSDTVSEPTAPMRAAIARAEVGDDVFGDDPTVNRLQALAAEITGKEAGLFVSSGTQANLVAVLAHCERGDEFIAGARAHTFWNEGGGAAVLGSVSPQIVPLEPDGTLDLRTVESVIKPDDIHHTRTRLLTLENTIGGRPLPLSYFPQAAALAERHGLGMHLDGARVFNAAVSQGVEVAAITAHFDTVSFCVSKGLGAPIGSLLCGPADLIRRAHRWRKVLGGAMRQVGILAAAGIYALENNVERLAEDHANAAALAEGLGAIDGISVELPHVTTNMVFADLGDTDPVHLAQFAAARGIRLLDWNPMRFVTHLGVGREDIDRVVELFRDYFAPAA